MKEQDRRRDREQEEHQRDSARFKEEQAGLQRIRKQLEDELTELRYRHTWRPPDSLLHRNAHLSTSSLSLSLSLSLPLCRSLAVSLHQQLHQQQKQLSESEVDRCQLQTHINTLQQSKDTLLGQCDNCNAVLGLKGALPLPFHD